MTCGTTCGGRGLLALQGGGVVVMYLMVLLWRLHLKRHALPYGRQARRAGYTCFVTGLAVLLAQLGLAWVCWHYGLRLWRGAPGGITCAPWGAIP